MSLQYIKSFRKIIKVGNAFYINLPRKFLDRHGLTKGDSLFIHGNTSLTIQKPDPDIGGENLKVTPMEREDG